MPLCSRLTREQSNALYYEVIKAEDTEGIRRLCREDLFFLLTVACKRMDINRDWLYKRCRQVEADRDGYLDLWAREHYKSTLITFGLSIQDILVNPEVTIGIFSHTRPTAKAFLEQIKREFEDNTFLKDTFPDILYKEPRREASTWSLDGGILVKRKTNPRNKTIEAHGLVDGQPIGSHFLLLVYDDVVTRESVTTPDQIKKVNEAFALSLNLAAEGGAMRAIGTRYHFNDTYRMIIERRIFDPRIHTATHDGTIEGTPVLWDAETLATKRRNMGPYIAACQLFQNPKEDSVMGFEEEWLRFYEELKNTDGWNYYILVDPAGDGKKKHSNDPDYSVILVMATAPDGNIYLIDGVRDRINLTQRTKKIFQYHRKYKPIAVGYEKYGKDSDIEHIEAMMELENYRFDIIAVAGNQSKNDRIRRLVPAFEQGKIWLPAQHMYMTRDGQMRDLIKEFTELEYSAFPVPIHDDILDCMSRIKSPELNVVYPEEYEGEYPSMTMGGSIDMAIKDYNVLRRDNHGRRR